MFAERDEPDGLDKDPYREDHIIAEEEGICQSHVFRFALTLTPTSFIHENLFSLFSFMIPRRWFSKFPVNPIYLKEEGFYSPKENNEENAFKEYR